MLRLVRQGHFNDAGDVTRRRLNADGVRCEQLDFEKTSTLEKSPLSDALDGYYLAPHEHSAKNDLQAVEKVVAHDDHRGPARCPALARTDGLNARRGRQRRVNTCRKRREKQHN